MQFQEPEMLWGLLLGLIPLLLYLFRRKSQRVSVSTLAFFKTLAQEHQETAWLRRFKKWLSYALTLLIIALVVLLLAHWKKGIAENSDYKTIVLLIDRSASMAVEDENGISRLEAARSRALERLESVPEATGIALVAYDSRAEVILPRSSNRRELLSRLGELKTRPVAGRQDRGVAAAVRLSALDPPAKVWHFSDAFSASAEADITEIPVALPAVTNASITALQIRPVSMEYGRYEVFVQVALNQAAAEAETVRMDLRVGSIPAQFREVDLAPGEKKNLTFKVTGSRRQLVKARVSCETDPFSTDDEVLIFLPESEPVLAAWIRPDGAEDPFTRLALSSIQESGKFELLKGSPEAWPLADPVDVVIFDGWLPEVWPADTPALVVNPPSATVPVMVRALNNPLPHSSFTTANENHPVLFRVSGSRLAVTQTSVFDTTGSLSPLWAVGTEPLLAAGELEGNRLVVVGFSPRLSSGLPFTASFPVLIANSLYWVLDGERSLLSNSLDPTGTLLEEESFRWKGNSADRVDVAESNGVRPVTELDRQGIWVSTSGEERTAHLLSLTESDLPIATTIEADYAVDPPKTPKWFRKSSVILLTLLGLVLLLESWLFHRHAVY